MRLTTGEKPTTKRSGRLARVLVLFFLVYTGADILMPQYFCAGEEVGNLPSQSRVVTPAAGADDQPVLAAFASSEDSHREQQPDQEPHGEDCFCCCAHVLPGISFSNVGGPELKSTGATFITGHLPSPPLRGTYHPPRFA